LIVSKTLKVIEEMVGTVGFVRTHHSHLVNLQEVKRMLRGDTACLIMRDGANVPVSRGRKAGLLELL
ncbi:MAG: LytTR family DNA-binding domain-containing protein, partial [Flavobacteriales bacterium]|nr:LytTR family DNA-binding domain-containing protein [Flavobacteriales bacterium]